MSKNETFRSSTGGTYELDEDTGTLSEVKSSDGPIADLVGTAVDVAEDAIGGVINLITPK